MEVGKGLNTFVSITTLAMWNWLIVYPCLYCLVAWGDEQISAVTRGAKINSRSMICWLQ